MFSLLAVPATSSPMRLQVAHQESATDQGKDMSLLERKQEGFLAKEAFKL